LAQAFEVEILRLVYCDKLLNLSLNKLSVKFANFHYSLLKFFYQY